MRQWPADAPLRLRSPDEPLAYIPPAESGTTYANFRRYDRLEETAARLIAHLCETAATRLILDLRDNSGGDYTLARNHLLYPSGGYRPSTAREAYVLIGRETYSAMVTATDFRRETVAVLVREPTGARPVGYQESGTFTLPRSGLRAHCAIRRYRFADTDIPAIFSDQRIDPDWNPKTPGHDGPLDWCLTQPI